ncbi:TonB-dependent receptor plug domain-containing protein [Flavobacterium sp. JP2137]|uniref:TonB-dependent receptor plug domain-containing protein n=1 Tax=Flavobacterium sp. JP2137 TaxID=3414510 RepID=UPI003D2FDE5C
MGYFNCCCLGIALSVLFPITVYSQQIEVDTTLVKMDEIVVVSRNPISERFSSTKIDQLDIYFDPASNGDALKAIFNLPASTNTSETANPVLRGAAADQSRVFVNGVPLLNPVRNSQDNGLGNFSLFNTELLHSQYVYASNPPLIYGNSSGGIVDIVTTKELVADRLQLSAALSSAGVLLNKRITDKHFVQLYANYQFPFLFTAINSANTPDLNDFSTVDFGVNSRFHLSEKLTLNSYNYYIDESFDGQKYTLNYADNAVAQQRRFFSINNLDFLHNHSLFKLSNLVDYSDTSYEYGNIDSKMKYKQFYIALSHKYKVLAQWTIQYGLDYSKSVYSFDEVLPRYWYALDQQAPTFAHSADKNADYTEAYLYTEYKYNSNFGGSAAVRKNLFQTNKTLDFISGQFSAYYKINNNHRFIFGLGNYNNYSSINYYNRDFQLHTSKQIALDYYCEKSHAVFTAAVYYKKDQGAVSLSAYERLHQKNILGFEWSYSRDLSSSFSASLSNVYLHQRQTINNRQFNRDLNYFVKANITYKNPKNFTAALVLNTRPGNTYNPVINGIKNESGYVEPRFSNYDEKELKDYLRIDFTTNKAFAFNDQLIIAYFSINNVLNKRNQAGITYNSDFSAFNYPYFQRRILYFGVQFRLGSASAH